MHIYPLVLTPFVTERLKEDEEWLQSQGYSQPAFDALPGKEKSMAPRPLNQLKDGEGMGNEPRFMWLFKGPSGNIGN